MQQIAIFTGIGGFEFSRRAVEYMAAKGHKRAKRSLEIRDEFIEKHKYEIDVEYLRNDNLGVFCDRDDPLVIETVRKFGAETKLQIVKIPDDVDWYIDESECGSETIHEVHRIWPESDGAEEE